MATQGEVYWIDLPVPRGSEPGYRRPAVVIQNDSLNRSAIGTVLVCPMTTNARTAGAPGNVLLAAGEANLRQPSVVNVSQMVAVDKSALDEFIGALSRERLGQIVAGIMRIITPIA